MDPGNQIRVGVLTVSDRCSAGDMADTSGPALCEMLTSSSLNAMIVVTAIVPDEIEAIQAIVKTWVNVARLDLVLTTGGTGFSPRDVTPEAITPLLHKLAPGLATTMMTQSLAVTPMAALSRPVCGVRHNCIIATLPDTERVAHRARHSAYRLVPMDEGIQAVLRHSQRREAVTKRISDTDLSGHVLAVDVFANEPLPPFPASVKDGYAVIASDGPGVYSVLGPSLAGALAGMEVTPGTVARITTGAAVPPGADAVVQVEDTELVESTADGSEELRIRVLQAATVGQDIRPVGFDIAAGETILTQGTVLGPSEIGLLATVGCVEVRVYTRPRVAILSTGNELVGPDEPLTGATIRDSNKSMLMAAVREAGAEPIDMGISRDTRPELADSIRRAMEAADIIITTGGVSMGEKDLLKPVLQDDIGAVVHFGRLFMKPGKPTTFATVGCGNNEKLVFALPGNPVSAMVTFHLFVHMAIRSLAGYPKPQLPTLSFAARLDPRPEYHRAILTWDAEGAGFVTESTGSQCSSRLSSMRSANALLVLPAASDVLHVLEKGALVDAILLHPL